MNAETFINPDELKSPQEKLKEARIAQLEARDIEDATPQQQKSYKELVRNVEVQENSPVPLTQEELDELRSLDIEQGRSTNWTAEMANRQKELRTRHENSGSKAA